MSSLRIPLALLGLICFFSAYRYFSAYDFFIPLIVVSYILLALSFAASLLLRKKAAAQNFQGEVQSWNFTLIWQILLVLGLICFQIYSVILDGKPVPQGLFAKLLLAVWLSLIMLGSFYGIGVELTARDSGKGATAEPARISAGGMRWLGIGMFFGFLFCINYVANKKDKAFDWSYFKTTKPGEATENIVRNLNDPVEIAAFFSRESDVGFHVRQYLERIGSISDQVQINFYDKDFAPVQAEQFRAARNGQIILKRDQKRQRIEIGDTLDAARKKLQTLDQSFQQSLLALVEEKKVIYLTQGHGEMSWKSSSDNPWRSLRNFERLLRFQNFQLRELALTTGSVSEIPNDAAAIAIIGPAFAFSESMLPNLQNYLDGGGKLLIFLDIEFSGEDQERIDSNEDPLQSWLSSLGITYHREMLANDRTFMRYTSRIDDHGFLATNNFSSHESVSTLAKNDERMGVIIYQSGYFQSPEEKSDWKLTTAIRSLATTFNDRNGNFQFDSNAGEARQAYPIGIAAQKGDAQIFAFADASLVSDPLIRNPGNQLAVSDVIKWLVGDMQFSGHTESEEDVKIQHSKSRELFVFHGSIYAIPLLVIFCGFIATRRKKGTGA